MLKTKIIIGFCFIIFSINEGFSQSKKEKVRELITLMKQDSLMDKMMDSMMPSFGLTELSESEKMKKVMKSMKAIMKKFVDDDMVNIYDKYFTEAELNDFITFYKSPSGQKFMKMQPDIQKEVMDIMMGKYMPDIMKAIEEVKN